MKYIEPTDAFQRCPPINRFFASNERSVISSRNVADTVVWENQVKNFTLS